MFYKFKSIDPDAYKRICSILALLWKLSTFCTGFLGKPFCI